MLDAFLLGLFLGVSIAVPIGPANLELVKRAFAGRSREAVAVGFGTALSDSLLSLLVYLGVVPFLLKIGVVKQLFYAVGGAMLLAIGFVSLWQTWSRENPLDVTPDAPDDPFTARYRSMNPVMLGFLINSTNPMVIGFWIVFFSSALQHRLVGRHAYELLLFAFAVFLGSFAWFSLLASFVAYGRRFMGRIAYLAVSTLCNATMAAVGAYFFVTALGLFGREIP